MNKPTRVLTPIKRILLASLLGVAASAAPLHVAHASCNSGSGTCTNTIKKIYVNGAGDPTYHFIELTGTEGAGAGCTLLSGAYWRVPKAQADLYRFLLAAVLAGREVTLRKVDNGTCTISYAYFE